MFYLPYDFRPTAHFYWLRNQNAKKKKKKRKKKKKKKNRNKYLKSISSETICCMRLRHYRNIINHISHYRFKMCVFFSSPEPKASGELIAWAVFRFCLSSGVSTFKQSPLNPLGRLRLNFICSILGLGLSWFIKKNAWLPVGTAHLNSGEHSGLWASCYIL